jgi:Pumilio-family RNA binding repeat
VMQQKIKSLDAAERARMCESFLQYTALLITNRFGNFLVQRCLEFGNPAQVNILKAYITGKVVALSKDPFGCHVVQRAFDTTPEDYKEGMIHELIGSIPETVIHRYACHVWQKLFELRWIRPNPIRIMDYVNNALRGTWKDVAQGETGSLVVQNIFENCHKDDKRMAINEILANMDEIARGQYGNWCIQHICEHGYDVDRIQAMSHILERAVQYSLDQYASKVIEKCLKIAAFNFLPRYLEQVCRPIVSRPRIPLIDIAADQYGNYLVQWILTNAAGENRALVVAHIR